MFFNVRVYGVDESIVASGYPKRSTIHNYSTEELAVSPKDINRALKLAAAAAGSGHDCFLKGIIVQADVTASHGWWMQAMRYHWFDIVSSQSKEHNCRALFGVEDPDQVKIGDKLTARITTNYLQLKTMYHQRKNHRREEWKMFCLWVRYLPYPAFIIGKE